MKSILLRLVAKNNCTEVIETLTSHFESNTNWDKLREVTLISNRYERFHEDRKKGEQVKENMDLAYIKITNSLMDLIASLDDKELKGLQDKTDKLSNIVIQEETQILDTKTKELANWLNRKKPIKAEKIAKKVAQIKNIGKIDQEKLTFELVNTLLILSDAVERNNLENLDYPEEIFRHHFSQKKVCTNALDLLFKEIPPRFDSTSIEQTRKIIYYLKERIINR